MHIVKHIYEAYVLPGRLQKSTQNSLEWMPVLNYSNSSSPMRAFTSSLDLILAQGTKYLEAGY